MKNLKARQFRNGDIILGHGIISKIRNKKTGTIRMICFSFDNGTTAIYPQNAILAKEEK